MEVQAVDIDDIRRILKGAFNVAIFPHTIPNSVRARFFVEDAVVGEGLFGNHGGNRLTLVKSLADGHGEVPDLLRLVRTHLDEGLRLRSNFFAGHRANY